MSDWDEHIKATVVPGYVEGCQIDLKTYCGENLVTINNIYIFVSKKIFRCLWVVEVIVA